MWHLRTSTNALYIVGIVFFLIILVCSIRIVRPNERGLVERLGKYHRYALPGPQIVIPLVERLTMVDITECLVDSDKREVITKDKLNATVAAQVYFKVEDNETSVKASEYNVYDYEYQIVELAKTTLRNIIGTMTLAEANSGRTTINTALAEHLTKETAAWGIAIVRTELKEIDPPQDVQATMNKVVMAENEKVAAVDFAIATQTKADGVRMAAIKEAEGNKQATILQAEGKAKAIELVNTAAQTYFTGQAAQLKLIEATQDALRHNSKIVLPPGEKMINVIGNLAGIA
jgi:regulator of protease activity HflC (stomatin/prohibitin superfamily)